MSQAQPKTGFPDSVKEIFDALRPEVTFLHANWSAFQQLYGTQESVDALNAVAPGAFSLIGLIFRREFISATCRITDQKAFGSGPKAKENLTLKQLLHSIKESGAEQAFVDELTLKEAAIDRHCQPFRERRNRIIGHLDLRTALDEHPQQLPKVDSKQIATFLAMLAELMNIVLGYYTAAYADFEPSIGGPARNIVHALKEFERLRQLEHKRALDELQAE
jgi:hypothetical protein